MTAPTRQQFRVFLRCRLADHKRCTPHIRVMVDGVMVPTDCSCACHQPADLAERQRELLGGVVA